MSDNDSSNSSKNIPSDAMMIMLAPDGYYKYLQVMKPSPTTTTTTTSGIGGDSSSNNNTIDIDVIKKNYRKLSIKHHPDKPGGDVETFRLLKRAQTVLTSPKLRQQYDILGLDLDDDDHDHIGDNTTSNNDSNDNKQGPEPQTTSQGIIQEIASMALTSVLQMAVRTGIMGLVSVFVCRYRWTFFPALCLLAYIAFNIHKTPTSGKLDLLSPCLIGIGLIVMYQSSSGSWNRIEIGDDGIATPINNWFLYWIGESLVIGMFTYNSFSAQQQMSPMVICGITIFAIISALWFRGKFWNYGIVLGLEVFFAIFIAMSFPIFEMILETILNDKLKKVGDKVRMHHEYMERYYRNYKAKE